QQGVGQTKLEFCPVRQQFGAGMGVFAGFAGCNEFGAGCTLDRREFDFFALVSESIVERTGDAFGSDWMVVIDVEFESVFAAHARDQLTDIARTQTRERGKQRDIPALQWLALVQGLRNSLQQSKSQHDAAHGIVAMEIEAVLQMERDVS